MLLGSFHVQNYDLYQFVALFFNINLMYSVCKRLRKQEGAWLNAALCECGCFSTKKVTEYFGLLSFCYNFERHLVCNDN